MGAMMRWWLGCVLLIASPALATVGLLQFGHAPSGVTTYQALAIGAGGYITAIDIAADGTKLIRTDTWGGYIWNGTRWVQLVTILSMPAADVGFNNATGDPKTTPQGVYEIVSAPSDTNTAYMHFNGYVYKTSNVKATPPTWARTACAQATAGTTDPNITYKWNGKKIAVDPANTNVFISGSGINGVRYSDDGGTTCTAITGITAASTPGGSTYPGYAIVFDPTSAISGGKTQGVYISSYGTGVYHSTTGGNGTYTLTTGTPTTHNQMSWQGGALWMTEQASSNGPWTFNGTTWSQKNTGAAATYYSVAIDPANSSRILVFDDGGKLNQSTNGGAAWTGPYFYAFPNCSGCIISTDIPWLQNWTNTGGSTYGGYLTLGSAQFDPTQSNKLYLSTGTGVYYGNLPSTYVAYNLTDESLGIEQLVANNVVVPTGGQPVVSSWDRPLFYVSGVGTYPSNYGPNYAVGINMGWSVDWSPQTPSTLVCLCNFFGPIDYSAKSTDGGQTWTPFAATPSLTPSGQVTIGGSISAASDTHYIIVQNNGTRAGVYYTANSGGSWTEATVGGVPSVASGNDTSWGHSYSLNRRVGVCSKVTVDLCWLYNAGLLGDATFAGVYQSTNGGASWSRVFNGVLTTWADGGFNSQLRAVPGQATHLFYTGGGQTGTGNIAITQDLMRSTNSGTTWAAVPNVKNVYAIGFGKEASGGSYPSIYIAGFVTFNGGSTYAWGIYRSTDGNLSTPTWTLVKNYPLDSFDAVTWIEGDMATYGDHYVGFRGSGWAYGHINFLLKRDLDPAANDNSPMWLNQAA